MESAAAVACPACTFLNEPGEEACRVCAALLEPERPLDAPDAAPAALPAPADAGPAADEDGGEAEGADRSAADALAQLVGMPETSLAFQVSTPSALLLLLLGTALYDHINGLHFVAVSLVVLITLEARFFEQVGLKGDASRAMLTLLALAAFSFAGVAYVMSCYEADGCLAPFARAGALGFRTQLPPERLSLGDTVFLALVSDVAIRAATLGVKAGWLATTRFSAARGLSRVLRRRRQQLAVIEVLSVGYRYMVSVQPWLGYYGRGRPMGVFLVGAYGAVKAVALGHLAMDLDATLAGFRAGLADTRALGDAELAEAGGGGADCPICFDRFAQPVALRCDHAFCEECIAEWLEKESTCPICRAQVAEGRPSRTMTMGYMDGSMSLAPTFL